MQQQINKKYKPLFTEKPRYIILMGGRGAGRSTVASQFAITKLISPEYFRCAIMRLILGDIRNSIYREITDRAEENGIKNKLDINDGQMVLTYGKNTINAVGFKKSTGQQKSKLKSLANYNYVIVEEADEIDEADFMQLDDSLRTVKGDITIVLLLNPPAKEHWIIKRWFDLVPAIVDGIEKKGYFTPQLKAEIKNTIFIRTNFRDNIENISEQSIENYNAYKFTKPDHYFNMIEGLVPETVRGKIYSGWNQIDAVPPEARLERRGLDYGYSNDPTAIVDVYRWNGAFIWDEVAYQKGLSNKQIADILNNQEITNVIVVPDSAEPKSNDELVLYGISVLPANKGQGSVNHGIQVVQSQPIFVTKRSVNIWKEYNNYAWDETKEGVTLNVPKPGYDHAMDAGRYAMETLNIDTGISDIEKYMLAEARRNSGTNFSR